ncbi:MAG: hypothetical protein EXS14_08800 [Planctomycetes bacterium]|nr:hypothetical protein [Planctomycetota bacterium]
MEDNQIREEALSVCKRAMFWGAFWCIGGTVVTVMTYNAASTGGGTYAVMWGAIVFGGYKFFRALYYFLKL